MTVNVTSKNVLKAVELLLLVAIFGLLLWSQPWSESTVKETRKITISGEATVESVPDKYVLSPYFQKSGTDKDAIKSELTQQANEAVEKLKELGVAEEDIELDASSYDYWYYRDGETGNLNIRLTITLTDKDLAQKAQDYLLNLENIEGQLTPQATFSEAKSEELEEQATEKATEDARNKAEKQAELLGAELGEVIEIGDSGTSPIYPYLSQGLDMQVAEDSSASSLPILPGKDEYYKTVNVTFELK